MAELRQGSNASSVMRNVFLKPLAEIPAMMSGQQPVSTIGTGHRFEAAHIAENNHVRPLYVSVPDRAV